MFIKVLSHPTGPLSVGDLTEREGSCLHPEVGVHLVFDQCLIPSLLVDKGKC